MHLAHQDHHLFIAFIISVLVVILWINLLPSGRNPFDFSDFDAVITKTNAESSKAFEDFRKTAKESPFIHAPVDNRIKTKWNPDKLVYPPLNIQIRSMKYNKSFVYPVPVE